MTEEEFEQKSSDVRKLLEASFKPGNTGYILVLIRTNDEKTQSELKVLGDLGHEMSKKILEDVLKNKVLETEENEG